MRSRSAICRLSISTANWSACSRCGVCSTKKFRNSPINSIRWKRTSLQTAPAGREGFLHVLTDPVGRKLDPILYGRMAVKNKLDHLVRRFVGEIQVGQLLHARDKSERITCDIKR